VITRDTEDEAWAAADRLLEDADDEAIASAQAKLSLAQAVGQRKQQDQRGSGRDRASLEIYPNLWTGIGLLRGGVGTALVGSHEQVAELIAQYHDRGLTEFILSGYPHVEEAYAFGDGVVPILRRRGLLDRPSGVASAPRLSSVG
jgi:alkanesulfonate monooxygenase